MGILLWLLAFKVHFAQVKSRWPAVSPSFTPHFLRYVLLSVTEWISKPPQNSGAYSADTTKKHRPVQGSLASGDAPVPRSARLMKGGVMEVAPGRAGRDKDASLKKAFEPLADQHRAFFDAVGDRNRMMPSKVARLELSMSGTHGSLFMFCSQERPPRVRGAQRMHQSLVFGGVEQTCNQCPPHKGGVDTVVSSDNMIVPMACGHM